MLSPLDFFYSLSTTAAPNQKPSCSSRRPRRPRRRDPALPSWERFPTATGLRAAPPFGSGLHKIIGHRKISHFIEDLVRPHVVKQGLAAAYKQMSQDQVRETEARDWSEGTLGDGHATW